MFKDRYGSEITDSFAICIAKATSVFVVLLVIITLIVVYTDKRITNSYESSKTLVKESTAVISKKWYIAPKITQSTNISVVSTGKVTVPIVTPRTDTKPSEYHLEIYCKEFNLTKGIESFSEYSKYKEMDEVKVNVYKYKDGKLIEEIKN